MVHKLLLATSLLLGVTLTLLFAYNPTLYSENTLPLARTIPRGAAHVDSARPNAESSPHSALTTPARLRPLAGSSSTAFALAGKIPRGVFNQTVSSIGIIAQLENDDDEDEEEKEEEEAEDDEEDVDVSSWEDYSDVKRRNMSGKEESSYDSDGDMTGYENLLPDGAFEHLDIKLDTMLDKERRVHTLAYSRDIMTMPPIPFLANYRNPCWYEAVEAEYPYDEGFYTKKRRVARRGRVVADFYHTTARDRLGSRGWRLRCLPYFLLLGMPKCGTTDLFYKLAHHQSIVWGGAPKEPHWWSRRSYSHNVSFEQYVDAFDLAAEVIMHNVSELSVPQRPPYHDFVTGEGSASTLWDSRQLWRDLPTSRTRPRHLTPHHIQHVLPHARFIIILRDPTDRLFSDYAYFTDEEESVSTEEFHARASYSVRVMQRCLLAHPVDTCVHKVSVRKETGHMMCAESPHYCDIAPVRLNVGMYSVFLKEWLQVFPLKQFQVVRLEEYSSNRISVLNRIVHFLGLEAYLPDIAREIETSSNMNTNSGQKLQMWPETQELLQQFYKPYNEALARILNDERYSTW